MSYRENYHPPLGQVERLAAIDREITFDEAQLACYSHSRPPHPGVKWGQLRAALHRRLDALDAERARLLETHP